PRTRSAIRKPPICAGVALPDIMISKACSACSAVSGRPPAATAISGLRSVAVMAASGALAEQGCVRVVAGHAQEVREDAMSVLGFNAFGMELHTPDRMGAMPQYHDDAVFRIGRDFELPVREGCAVDNERMVARRGEGTVDALEQVASAVPDLAELAMHRRRRTDNIAAKDLADRLVPEADAE